MKTDILMLGTLTAPINFFSFFSLELEHLNVISQKGKKEKLHWKKQCVIKKPKK